MNVAAGEALLVSAASTVRYLQALQVQKDASPDVRRSWTHRSSNIGRPAELVWVVRSLRYEELAAAFIPRGLRAAAWTRPVTVYSTPSSGPDATPRHKNKHKQEEEEEATYGTRGAAWSWTFLRSPRHVASLSWIFVRVTTQNVPSPPQEQLLQQPLNHLVISVQLQPQMWSCVFSFPLTGRYQTPDTCRVQAPRQGNEAIKWSVYLDDQ